MGIAIGVILVLIILVLIIFPEVRKKLKVLFGGFMNIFVEDMAKTPEGAKAVFSQAIEELQAKYNKASDTLNRFSGELHTVERDISRLTEELTNVETKCEALVRKGNMNDAAIYSSRREEILYEINQKKKYKAELEPMVREASTVHSAYEKKLRELKRQSRMTVEEIRLKGSMKDLLGDLDELRRDSATEKLLGTVNDGVKQLSSEVDGAIIVNANKMSTKMSIAEKNAAKAQSDEYLEALAAKYNKSKQLEEAKR